MAFFKAIGFSFNLQFTDKTAACMVMSDDIYAMLLTHDKVKEFSKKEIADAHKMTEVLTALAVGSKEKVNSSRIRRSGPVERRPIGRKITASCSREVSKTRTVTSGRYSGWTLRRCRRDKYRADTQWSQACS
jgi:hypothetical protein